MIDRKPQILQVAAELLQTRSFTAFSYQDLSDRLGIRKATIHHHFSTKDDLLQALAERFRTRQIERLRAIDESYRRPWDRLEAFLSMMASIMETGTKICPVGILQAEFNVLPERTRESVRQLHTVGRNWLAGLLAEGQESGEMEFEGSPEDRAALVLAALQGALQIARAHGPREFSIIVKEIRAGLRPRRLGT